jgi:hypothetical protein
MVADLSRTVLEAMKSMAEAKQVDMAASMEVKLKSFQGYVLIQCLQILVYDE